MCTLCAWKNHCTCIMTTWAIPFPFPWWLIEKQMNRVTSWLSKLELPKVGLMTTVSQDVSSARQTLDMDYCHHDSDTIADYVPESFVANVATTFEKFHLTLHESRPHLPNTVMMISPNLWDYVTDAMHVWIASKQWHMIKPMLTCLTWNDERIAKTWWSDNWPTFNFPNLDKSNITYPIILLTNATDTFFGQIDTACQVTDTGWLNSSNPLITTPHPRGHWMNYSYLSANLKRLNVGISCVLETVDHLMLRVPCKFSISLSAMMESEHMHWNCWTNAQSKNFSATFPI